MSTLKHGIDGTAIATAIASWRGWFDTILPHSWSEFAAMLSAVYLIVRILESDSAKKLMQKLRRKCGLR